MGKIENLKSLALFSHLSDEKLSELTRVLKELTFTKDDVIFEEDSHGDSLFLLADGQVRIEKKVASEDGYKDLALLSPGDFFGEMALIEETPRSARAVAHSDVAVFVLARKELFEWLKSEPVMALGFFVELLRVFSGRLRHTSAELTLLYDVSHLLLGNFKDGREFLQMALKRVVPHLEGDWSAAAYLYNPFNDDIDRVSTYGEGSFPDEIPSSKAQLSGWIDASTFRVELPGDKGPQGYLYFKNAVAMSPQEKDEAAITLTTVAHLVSSALQNISHRAEEASRARLDKSIHGSVQM